LGKKSGSKALKRTMAPNFWRITKKEKRFVTKPSPGPHSSKLSIPIVVLLRDVLNLTNTYSETKIVIRDGGVIVDGCVRKDYNYSVGLMDVVEIPKLNSIYRLVPSKRLIEPIKISKSEKNIKLCKILGKKSLSKDVFQYSLHDGRNINLTSNEANVGSTMKIEIPSQKVKKILDLKTNNLVVLIGGQNKGKIGKITNISPSSFSRPKMLEIDVNDTKIEVQSKFALVIGENQSELNLIGE